MSWPSANGDKCRPGLLWRYRPGSPLRRKRLSDARADMDYLTRHIQPGGKMRTVIAVNSLVITTLTLNTLKDNDSRCNLLLNRCPLFRLATFTSVMRWGRKG